MPLPEEYGHWRGVCNRLRTGTVDGTWERGFTALMAQSEADEKPGRLSGLHDRAAHQRAAGCAKKTAAGETDGQASVGPAAD
ncbi:hypothetical protein ACFY1C_20225 [Streptomyces sp. NPDC001279]|uniref:hypothetical protein n=1 Tax=Streptomyces sp. NPDC001279 TaxID=3364556 RepID=UPI00368FC92B